MPSVTICKIRAMPMIRVDLKKMNNGYMIKKGNEWKEWKPMLHRHASYIGFAQI